MPELEVNGIHVRYRESGNGPAVVLVHGLGGSAELWDKVVPDLAADCRVVSYDLRGAGQTDKPDGPYSLELLVSDLAALADRLALTPATVVGHSMAGAVVLSYAAKHPDRVSAVVGVGAVTELPDAARQGMRDRADLVLAGGMAEVAEAVAANGTDPSWQQSEPAEFEAFKDAVAANDPQGYATLALLVSELDVTDALARVSAPVLLVGGESDPVSPPAANEANVARLQSASYVPIPGCGHIVPLEKPHALLTAARPFVEEHASIATSG